VLFTSAITFCYEHESFPDWEKKPQFIWQMQYGDVLEVPQVGNAKSVKLYHSKSYYDGASRFDDSLPVIDAFQPDLLNFSEIEQMITKNNLPITGWVPYDKGLVHFYHKQAHLIEPIRRLVKTPGQLLTKKEIRNIYWPYIQANDNPDRLFDIVMKNLIEDHQGLVKVDEHVRLSTWRETIDACADLCAIESRRNNGDIVVPQIYLYDEDSYSWTIHQLLTGEYFIMSFKPRPHSKAFTVKTLAAVDMLLNEHQVPLGWATGTTNESSHQRLLQSVNAKYANRQS
jgi:hypothetical protein